MSLSSVKLAIVATGVGVSSTRGSALLARGVPATARAGA
eukprot:CAMPEP_0176035268 /NCGR_PEP_ID=MMETSP0120_2-20121206/17441_1 /TAXON_ID=160619 /ORGANISM="Kryptoperidinium foliaceum, Strain CCMP 1326" /LENGTH=38 /DNA_ID= /DNA_START= /DNA_END= /DNA_ORIENTATION=